MPMQIKKGSQKMKKQNYVEPDFEWMMFETEDVITASSADTSDGGIELPDFEW